MHSNVEFAINLSHDCVADIQTILPSSLLDECWGVGSEEELMEERLWTSQ